jgi:uncharacterized protein YkwD
MLRALLLAPLLLSIVGCAELEDLLGDEAIDQGEDTGEGEGEAAEGEGEGEGEPGEGEGEGEPGEGEGEEPTTWSEPELEMLRLVNAFRAAGGDCPSGSFSSLPPLTGNDALGAAARDHSQDMADNDYFDHVSLDGRSFADRIVDAGYDAQPYGENIAAGNTDPEATFEQWRNSDGHCLNMTTRNANEIGVGFASGGSYGAYWTQVFGVR